MGERRIPGLGTSLRRYEDPATSGDPKIRELVEQLRALDVAPPPRTHFKAELRAQLVAVAPRLIAEGPAAELRPSPDADQAVGGARAGTTSPAARRAARFGVSVRRPLAVVVGALTVFAVLLGGAVWISNRALPGDALYALKRANENVQLSFTHGTERARTYLSFASTRADEVKSLLSDVSAMAVSDRPTAGSGVNAHTAKLVKSTLGSADEDVRNAAQLIGRAAVDGRSATPLAIMTKWAPAQIAKLQGVVNRLPAGELKDRVTESVQLVKAARQRAVDLGLVVGCDCLQTTSTDELGPVPCAACPTAGPGAKPTQPSVPGSTRPGTPPTQNSSSRSTGSATPGAGQPAGGVSSVSPSPTPTGGLTLPTVPGLPAPTSAPVTTDSCGVSASLGPIGVGLGTCGIRVTL